jgi:hypothetical protein
MLIQWLNGVALHIIVIIFIWVRNEQVIYYGLVFFESLYITIIIVNIWSLYKNTVTDLYISIISSIHGAFFFT